MCNGTPFITTQQKTFISKAQITKLLHMGAVAKISFRAGIELCPFGTGNNVIATLFSQLPVATQFRINVSSTKRWFNNVSK